MLKIISARTSTKVLYHVNATVVLALLISTLSTGCLRMRVRPGRATLPLDQSVSFTAGLYNRKGIALNAGTVAWKVDNITEHRAARISPDGTFSARLPGKYKITASSGKHKGHATLMVPDGITRDYNRAITETTPVSSLEPGTIPSPLPPPAKEGPGWDDAHWRWAYRSENHKGRDPLRHYAAKNVQNIDSGSGNGNYLLSVPILNLPGRGLDLALTLFYNSKLWNLDGGGDIVFNKDKGWPAPGWSLGFGRAVRMGSFNVAQQDADGTIHPFSGTINTYLGQPDCQQSTDFATHTIDGTMIDTVFSHNCGNLAGGKAKYPDGRIVEYGAAAFDAIYPTRITDANGNYITIAYRNNRGPEIESIRDTLGRVTNFSYDNDGLLTAITAPGMKKSIRTVARLHYANPGFAFVPSKAFAPSLQPGYTDADLHSRRIDAIYFPGSSTGYWFGPEAYSSYGMIAKVSERRDMSLQAGSVSDQDTVDPGKVTRERSYNYPFSPDPTLTDAPAYTQLMETWETGKGLNTDAPAVTTYSVHMNDNPRRVETTYPDGTRVVQLMHNDPKHYDDGLLYSEETHDSLGRLLRTVATSWEPGDYESPRVASVRVTDELGQTTKKQYSYDRQEDSAQTNQLNEIQEFDYDGSTVLRRTHTDYAACPAYAADARHIFNLPRMVQVFGIDPTDPQKHERLEAQTEYQYDQYASKEHKLPKCDYDGRQALFNTWGVINHSDASDRSAPAYWVPPDVKRDCSHRPCKDVDEGGYWVPSDYDWHTDYRGNVTQVTRYADAASQQGKIETFNYYDIDGNLVGTRPDCCEWTSLNYTIDTQYAYPTVIGRGAPLPSTARLTTLLSYDFNTGLKVASTDPNGHRTQYSYDAALRPSQITLPTAATIEYSNNDAQMATTQSIHEANGSLTGQTLTQLNGRGLVGETRSLAPGGKWSVVAARYDLMGRQTMRSQPFSCEVKNNGACNAEPTLWNETTFDALGRTTATAGADGSQIHYYYNESTPPSSASGDPGQTVRFVDPVGRERWSRRDALGRVAEVVEPNPKGKGSVLESGSLTTSYVYNALGLLLSSTQGSALQQRIFQYDSLGRLLRQYLPEKDHTLTDDGHYDANQGKWSDIFSYDERSNLISHIDARGINAIYDYDNDPLNRLQRTRYDESNCGQDEKSCGNQKNTVIPTLPVTYTYMPTGDVTRLSQVSSQLDVDNSIVQQYGYDSEGRLASKTFSYPNNPSLVLNFDYDTLNRLRNETYPAEYGFKAGNPRQTIAYEYQIGGSLKRLQVDEADYVSSIKYNQAGQMTSMQVGPSGNNPSTDTFSYNAATGLIDGQQAQRASGPLLDLAYDYFPGGQLRDVVDHAKELNDRSYAYDALSRLQSVSGPLSKQGTWTESYTFDEYGNRTNVELSPATAPIPVDGFASRTYDPQTNRAKDLNYDATGNIVRAKRIDSFGKPYEVRYRYDDAGRLSMASDENDKPVEAYVYGPDRHRLGKLDADTRASTVYVWDGDRVAAEYRPKADSLAWSKSTVYLGGSVLATLQPGKSGEPVVSYHHPDRLGTRLITNNIDNTFVKQFTLPFGTFMPDTSSEPINPVFTSYERSAATGLDYAINRQYDSQDRFTQPDPLQTMTNLYTYAGNDPINKTDPTGLREKDEFTLPFFAQWNLFNDRFRSTTADASCEPSESDCKMSGFGGGWGPGDGNDSFLGVSGERWGWGCGEGQCGLYPNQILAQTGYQQFDLRTAMAIQSYVSEVDNSGGGNRNATLDYLGFALSPQELEQALRGAASANASTGKLNTQVGMLAASDPVLMTAGVLTGGFTAARVAQTSMEIAGLVGTAGEMPAGLALTQAGAWASPAGGVVAAFGAGYLVGQGIEAGFEKTFGRMPADYIYDWGINLGLWE